MVREYVQKEACKNGLAKKGNEGEANVGRSFYPSKKSTNQRVDGCGAISLELGLGPLFEISISGPEVHGALLACDGARPQRECGPFKTG